MRIESGSPLVGRTLRQSGLPVSIIVTTIQRRRDLVVPDGSTVLEAGDELLLIGQTSDIDAIRRIASDGADPGSPRPCEGTHDVPPGPVDPGTGAP